METLRFLEDLTTVFLVPANLLSRRRPVKIIHTLLETRMPTKWINRLKEETALRLQMVSGTEVVRLFMSRTSMTERK